LDNAARALEIAREVGFDLAGIAPLAPPAAGMRFRSWLAAGRHAGMDWLAESAETILDPARLLRGGKSLLVVGMSHARAAAELPGGGRVARYAAGRDYHNVIERRLRKLARRLVQAELGGEWRKLVDAAPLLERSHAAEAGLGFESKAANLLAPGIGPWFFLGELLLERELEPTPGPAPGSCGTCTACLDACPTQAIVAPGIVDSNLCISYHTIENRGVAPRALRAAVSEWAFGCDVCSEVCPWGREAPEATERFGTHPMVETSLVDWLRHGADEHATRFEGSALRRARRAGLARNAALALGAAPSDAGRAALVDALATDPEPTVRASAGWALARAHRADAGARAALERAAAREPDAATAADLRSSLDGDA
jgi:epoxyqueuosine reductase